MDWGMIQTVAAVVVPTVGAAAAFTAKLTERNLTLILQNLETKFELLIANNNDALLTRINGAYVKKETLQDKIEATVAKVVDKEIAAVVRRK